MFIELRNQVGDRTELPTKAPEDHLLLHPTFGGSMHTSSCSFIASTSVSVFITIFSVSCRTDCLNACCTYKAVSYGKQASLGSQNDLNMRFLAYYYDKTPFAK